MPGQTGQLPGIDPGGLLRLQWRAGQLPGQTSSPDSVRVRPDHATRQLQWRAGQLPGQTMLRVRLRSGARRISFNGGPGNCPAKHRAGTSSAACAAESASMEGRAIARPNDLRSATEESALRRAGFNGGPGNCPAKLTSFEAAHARSFGPGFVLQWRAGQLPGQTERYN